jgi:signal transduction histidine kinase
VEQFDIPILGISEKNNILFANDRMLQVLERRKENVIGHDVGSLAKANDLLRLLVRAESPDDDRQLFRVVLNGNERLFSKRTIVIDTELPDSTQLSHDRFIIMDDVTDFIQKDVRKTQFMATLSHELKTPVAAIEMSTDLLSSLKVGHLNEEQKGYVDKINEQTSRIRRMVNEILDLSKIEAGTIDFDMEPIGVGTLVEEAIQTVQPFLAYENIRIEKQVEENIPPIKVDSHKVLWTLNNFLTNAIRYTPKQGAITVSAFSRNGMVHIEVSDKGPGIKAKDQQRIFEKYVRLNKNEKGGTGLGLAISKEFIEAMGGEIGVRSHENEGATFWIRLKPQ